MPEVEKYLRVYYLSSSAPEEKLLCLEWKNISECVTSAPQPLKAPTPGVEEYLRVCYLSSSAPKSSYAWSGGIFERVLPQLLSP
jgi:hypothetical protein